MNSFFKITSDIIFNSVILNDVSVQKNAGDLLSSAVKYNPRIYILPSVNPKNNSFEL